MEKNKGEANSKGGQKRQSCAGAQHFFNFGDKPPRQAMAVEAHKWLFEPPIARYVALTQGGFQFLFRERLGKGRDSRGPPAEPTGSRSPVNREEY
jgi:hypothetical protein